MRLGEAVGLEWPQVDLEARGVDGEPVGEISLSGATTKTKRSRRVSSLHVPTNRITGILNAMRALTPQTALRLERFFAGTTAQFWLNLQTTFDLRHAEIASAKALREIRPQEPSLRHGHARR
ncbi:MAG: HigA family addiction module antitoxin [Polyangiaceae bacterium]